MSQFCNDPISTSGHLPIRIKSFLLGLWRLYGRFERPISSLSIVGGFAFDALALRRVDVFWDNFWVVAHLAIVTACVVWINLLDDSADESGARPEANPRRLHFWLVNVMQFFFGGILSVYLVFYFRSGTITTSWPFLSLLALTFIANGSLKRRFARLWFQIALLFLAIYAFAIYMMPILVHEVSTRVFWLSSAVSVGAIAAILLIVAVLSRRRFAGGRGWFVFGSLAGILVVVNGLYFLNVIPPLPLSLKEAGVYHSIVAKGPGDYTATVEPHTNALASIDFLARFFAFTETVHITPGESLAVYTAVFAPTALSMKIIHEWQYYDPTRGAWTTRHRVPLTVVGGRGGGYRTFSRESGITPGRWRVNVETQTGRLIGRLNFDAIVQKEEPPLLQEIIS